MRHLHLLPPALAFGLALAPQAAAQTPPSQTSGLASALASGLSLDPAQRIGLERTFVKAPLNQIGAPPAFAAGVFPIGADYSLGALFPGLDSVIEIDAHSTGNDLIPPLQQNGAPSMNGMNWMTLVVSVDNQAIGRPNSLIRDRVNNTQGRSTPGSDLYSYYFEQSVGIAAAMVNRTMVEQAAEQIAYPGEEDIDGLDFALGVQAHAQTTNPMLIFPTRDQFYFSLASSCVGTVNVLTGGAFAWNQGNQVPADAATIYWMEWNSTQGMWADPSVYLEPAQLALSAGDGDDVDALGVDHVSGTVIFSTQVVPGRSQLQGYDPTLGAVGTLRTGSGRKVTRKLGSIDDTDDIDAVCIFDPEKWMLGTHVGTPTALMKRGKKFMGLSVTRAKLSSIQDVLLVQVSGWGQVSPTDSTVTLQIAAGLPPGFNPSSAAWMDFAKADRGKKDDFVEFSFPIPPGLSLPDVALVAQLHSLGGTILERSVISQFNL